MKGQDFRGWPLLFVYKVCFLGVRGENSKSPSGKTHSEIRAGGTRHRAISEWMCFFSVLVGRRENLRQNKTKTSSTEFTLLTKAQADSRPGCPDVASWTVPAPEGHLLRHRKAAWHETAREPGRVTGSFLHPGEVVALATEEGIRGKRAAGMKQKPACGFLNSLDSKVSTLLAS